jgi:hypothetical protein
MFRKIIFSFFFLQILCAKEPSLVFFENAVSNAIQIYSKDGYRFECKAYGIISLEEFYQNAKENSVCRKEIVDFYEKSPKLRDFISSSLHYKQLYHIDMKSEGCISYVDAQRSVSEILLSEGLAIVKPLFQDEELKTTFERSQRKAKIEKRGLWSENIFKDCIKELYNK